MRQTIVCVFSCALALNAPDMLEGAEKASPERGREYLFHQAMNPPVWPISAYENLWKQWGLSAKPAYYAEAVRARYGLHQAPFDNQGLPLGLQVSWGLFGKGVINNCLLCHAGSVDGQTYIGVANASLDLQSLFEDLTKASSLKVQLPFSFSAVRGTIDPLGPVAYLMQFRDPDLNLRPSTKLVFRNDACSDPPAWWLLKKKQTRGWTGGLDVHSTRVDMINLLSPLNNAAYIKGQESSFADLEAFIRTVEAPRYPFAIDRKLAEQGRQVFVDNCSRCHGTYDKDGSYPNKIVPLGTIGTDRTLAEGMTEPLFEHFNQSWFAQEIGQDGKKIQAMNNKGYQAPPLDGVWATAPYFHNSSAPTVYHVLNSAARPKYFTRSYRTGKDDYDTAKLGWKITVLSDAPSTSLSGYAQRKIYDSTQPGRANTGHTFGDKLSEPERMAVIEYLKTL
jgi:hypothetical protein